MGNTLTKDEKIYIRDTLTERFNNFKESMKISKENLSEAINKKVVEFALENTFFKTAVDAMKNLLVAQKVDNKGLVFENSYYGYDNIEYYKLQGFRLKIISDCDHRFECKVKLTDEQCEEIGRLLNTFKTLNDNENKINNLKLEEYFILFSTWRIRKEERLNKVNELIDIIFDNITDGLK